LISFARVLLPGAGKAKIRSAQENGQGHNGNQPAQSHSHQYLSLFPESI
jgi:hypothetical protein